ncbi:MAG TPA: DUF4336 domain-containing protein [Sphingomonas sp.]|nr:DUF4336 domain-containing protein [Sphingomonas sp.]
MLRAFAEEIWIADGPTADVAGFRYPTRMAVIRLPGGALFIWSPVALCDDLRVAVDALGEVRHIVAPNALHHLFIGEWQAAYPFARLYAAPGLRKRRKDIVFDGDLDDNPAPGWSGEIDQVVMRGNAITSEVVFFHRRSGTVIFTDLIQHFTPGWFNGWRAMVARWDLMTAPQPAVPRKFRMAFLDRRAARSALRRILAWPAEKVLMAHAAPIEAEGQAFIARAFAWLT